MGSPYSISNVRKILYLIDVGWNGTIQDCLYNMKIHEKLYGYYIGITKDSNLKDNNIKIGLLFDNNNKSVYSFDHHNFEYVCLADHGATTEYNENGIPILVDDGDCVLYERTFKFIRLSIISKFKEIDDVLFKYFKKIDLEHYISYYHTKMLLSFSNNEKKIIKNSIALHPDNFINIKPDIEFKKKLWFIKRCLCLRYQQCVMYYKIMRSKS